MNGRWSIIAAQLPGRTDNDIKNYWNTKLKKKLMGMMIFPSSSTSYKRKSPLFPATTISPSAVVPFQPPPPPPPPQQSIFSLYTPSIRSPFSTMESLSSIQHPNFMCDNAISLGAPTSNGFHQSQNQGFLNPMQYNTAANSSHFLMFGGAAEAASGSSSSDGSCINKMGYGSDKANAAEIIKQEPDLLGNCFQAQIVSTPTATAFFEDQIQTQKFFVDYTHHVGEAPSSDEHHFFSNGGHYANNTTAATTTTTNAAATNATVNNNNNNNSISNQVQYDLEVVTQLVSSSNGGHESNNGGNNDGFYLFNDESKTDQERGMYYYYYN